MKKGLIFTGIGLIVGPIVADVIFIFAMIFIGISGGGSAGSVVAVSLISTFGGIACLVLTVLLIMVGIVLIIVGALIDSEKKQGV